MRRHLRALSAVNRQLHAQIETGTVRRAAAGPDSGESPTVDDGMVRRPATLTPRRVSEGSRWLEQLQIYGGGDPYLVRAPTEGVFLVEGELRRRIKSGLLFAELARALGEPAEIKDSAIAGWREGPPVELLEGGTGRAFIVVGGRRLPIRGLPLPYLVSTEEMLLFPEGEELNVASARRAGFGGRIARARKLIAREGVLRGAVYLLRRAVDRVRRAPQKRRK